MMLTQEELEKCENPYEEIEKMAKGLVEEIQDREYNRGYEKGMEDAWETVKWICLYPDISTGGLIDIFGRWRIDLILSEYSPKEAKEKIDNYIKKKKKNMEFHVGDEVTFCGERFIVTSVDEDCNSTLYAIGANGLLNYFNKGNRLTKTGRHFDEVDKLLKMLKED